MTSNYAKMKSLHKYFIAFDFDIHINNIWSFLPGTLKSSVLTFISTYNCVFDNFMTSRGFKDFWRELLANIMSGKLKWFWTQNVAQICNSLNAENWKSFAPDIFELYENIYIRRRGKKGGGGPIQGGIGFLEEFRLNRVNLLQNGKDTSLLLWIIKILKNLNWWHRANIISGNYHYVNMRYFAKELPWNCQRW